MKKRCYKYKQILWHPLSNFQTQISPTRWRDGVLGDAGFLQISDESHARFSGSLKASKRELIL